jgi:ribosomal-protein-serine acetyltransferase
VNIPQLLKTERLLLRPWLVSDAGALGAILNVNYAHLGPWIPSRIATPASVTELDRLKRFGDDFESAREWRYAMLTVNEELLGEISLFPRSVDRRVPYAQSDRIEIGYWIRKDMTGNGFVTEAVAAVLALVAADPRFTCAEVRCDERNAPSGAVPARLGFKLTATVAEEGVALQIWTLQFNNNGN